MNALRCPSLARASRLVGLAALFSVLSACGAAQPGDEPAAPAVGQATHALCAPGVYQATFGLADAYAGGANSDPVAYSPNPAMPAFMNYLASSQGIPLSQQTSFDNPNADHKVVATMRHGLKSCFFNNCTLKMIFRAKALTGNPGDDRVAVFNTLFTSPTSFSQIYNDSLLNLNGAPWTTGQDKTFSVDLTAQMNNGVVGDMLQFLATDDTMIDYVQLKLTCS